MVKIDAEAMRHLSTEKSSPLAASLAGSGFFLARDFVEVVLTSVRHFRVTFEEIQVHFH